MSTTELAAGRALDAEIARRVFGIKRLYDHSGEPWDGASDFPQYIPKDKPWRTHSIDSTVLPWFSTNVGAAMQVFEALVEMTGAGSIHADMEDARGEGFVCSVTLGFDEDEGMGSAIAPLPLAICRAALAALADKP